MRSVKGQIFFRRTTVHTQERFVKSGVAVKSVFQSGVYRFPIGTYFRQRTVKPTSVYVRRQRDADRLCKHTLIVPDRIARHIRQLFGRDVGFQVLFDVFDTFSYDICVLHERPPSRDSLIISHKIGKNISCCAVIDESI